MIYLVPVLSVMIVSFVIGVFALVYIIKAVKRQAEQAAKSDYRDNLESWHFNNKNHQNLFKHD